MKQLTFRLKPGQLLKEEIEKAVEDINIKGETYELIMKELNVSEKTVAHISNILAMRGEGFRTVIQYRP